jgi:hypothetical protein
MDNGVDGPVVELRVHGVSGTPPEAVLDAPQVRQVAGDEWARVFRAVDDDGREVGAPGHVVEALRTGAATRRARGPSPCGCCSCRSGW